MYRGPSEGRVRQGFLQHGIIRPIWNVVRTLLLWAFSSPFMIIIIPLIFVAVILLMLVLFLLFIVLAPLMYFAVRQRMRRARQARKVIEAEYWVDGERKG